MVVFGLFQCCLAGCSGTLPFTCESSSAGGAEAVEPCENTGVSGGGNANSAGAGGKVSAGGASVGGGNSSNVGQSGAGGARGAVNTGGAAAIGGSSGEAESLVANGSFERDQQPASLQASTPPGGWSMVSSSSVGNLLHAIKSDGTSDVPPAADGLNVARFDSLTGSTYREARSECFLIDASRALTARYQVRIPASQSPLGTKAAVKLWYYQDLTCATPSAVRPSDTQQAVSAAAADVWEKRQFTPSQNPPSDGIAASISIRAATVAGPNCGSGGADCASDRLYFDDIVVTQ